MFNIDDSVLSLIPTIFDAKLCNYYIDGADIVIETKEQYLSRIDLEIRAPEALVTMLFPKTGYTSLGRYPIQNRHAVLANYEGAYYTFVEGIEDANFIEKLLPNKVKTKHSITGDGKVGTEVKLVNDLEVVPNNHYYGTNEDGQGRGYKPFPPIEDSLPDIVNNNYFITYMKNFMERCKLAYLVEPVNNTSISQVSTWSVEPYNFWIGLFKATVNISDLVDETITILSTTYGYDTEGTFRELNSENITAAPVTLILSVNVNNLLTATLTGMSTNGKRILFCFERCCLYTRVRLIYGTSTDTATVEGILTAKGLLQGESTDTATTEGLLLNKLTMVGESTDTATAEGTLSSKGNISGESTDTATTEGLLIAKGNMLGESTDTAEAVATLSAKGNMAGTSTDTATVTATPSNIHRYFIMGESIDRATATGRLVGYTIDKIRGTSTDTATVTGNLINVGFCLEVDNGSIFTIKNISGNSSSSSSVLGNLANKPQEFQLLLEFQTDSPSNKTLDPSITAISGEYKWDIDGVEFLGTTPSTTLDGTLNTVKLYGKGNCNIIAIDFFDDNIVGSLNLSNTAFKYCSSVWLMTNRSLNGIQMPLDYDATVTLFILDECAFTGNVDLSFIKKINNATISIGSNPGVTSLTLYNDIIGTIRSVGVRNCNIIGTLDLTTFKTGSQLVVNAGYNTNLTGISYNPNFTATVSMIEVNNTNYTGNMDLFYVTAWYGSYFQINIRNTPSLTNLIIPSNISGSLYGIYASNSNITGVLDLTSINNFTDGCALEFDGCPNLTGVSFNNSGTTGYVYKVICKNTAITTLDLTKITIKNNMFVGEPYIEIGNNASLTSILFKNPTICNFSYIRIYNNSLTTFDISRLQNILSEYLSLISINNNKITAAHINKILYDLDNLTYTSSSITIDLSGDNAAPDSSSGGYNGIASKASLQAKGFTVNSN